MKTIQVPVLVVVLVQALVFVQYQYYDGMGHNKIKQDQKIRSGSKKFNQDHKKLNDKNARGAGEGSKEGGREGS